MTERWRTGIVIAALLAILVSTNLQIADKEAILADGTTVLLRLAPVDPRSLLQGDYMALRYAITGDIADAAKAAGLRDGTAVVSPDETGAARFVRIDDGRPLADDELRLRFRRRGDSVRVASDAFFFEEGAGASFANARFGELRVADDGAAVLVGLRAEDGQRLPEAVPAN